MIYTVLEGKLILGLSPYLALAPLPESASVPHHKLPLLISSYFAHLAAYYITPPLTASPPQNASEYCWVIPPVHFPPINGRTQPKQSHLDHPAATLSLLNPFRKPHVDSKSICFPSLYFHFIKQHNSSLVMHLLFCFDGFPYELNFWATPVSLIKQRGATCSVWPLTAICCFNNFLIQFHISLMFLPFLLLFCCRLWRQCWTSNIPAEQAKWRATTGSYLWASM